MASVGSGVRHPNTRVSAKSGGMGVSWRPAKNSSAEQMQMEMEDGLSRAWAYVVHGAVSTLNAALAGDFGGDQLAVSQQLGIGFLGFFQADDVLFRNDQHVRGGLRVDVLEGESFFVFVNLF